MSEHHGEVWWTELMTRDVESAKAYYSKVCGWTWETMPMGEDGDYHLAMRAGKPVAGMMDMAGMDQMADVPPYWFSYFAVDDVDDAARATEAAGGKIIRAPWDVPNTGRIAILEDPTGAAMGLMTPAEMP